MHNDSMNAKLTIGNVHGSYSWTSFPRRRVHSKAAAWPCPIPGPMAANPTAMPAATALAAPTNGSILDEELFTLNII